MSLMVEFAKSGRASCKKCKEKIEKGAIRIGKSTLRDDIEMTSWYHPGCLPLPKGRSPEEVVDDLLEDASGGEILPDKRDELVAALGAGKKTKKSPAKDEKKGSEFVAALAAEYKKREAGESVEDEPDAKKAKTGDSDHEKALALYGKYYKCSTDALKEILRYNKQVLSGNKSTILHKVLDGEMNGRLARCTVCSGRLKIEQDFCSKVVCGGQFDEESQVRIPCDVTYSLDKAPRWQPWYSEEPTEEQKEEMDALEEAAKNGEATAAVTDPDVENLMKQAEGMKLDFQGKENIRISTQKMVEFLQGATPKLDLPDDEKTLKQTVGRTMLQNPDFSPAVHVKVFAAKFGFVQAKEEKSKLAEAAVEQVCAEPKNAPLLLCFKELADIYFKQGNRNAGSSYTRVVNALKELTFEVTAENAIGLSKGKTKVANIGATSAKLMKEFLTTGTMQKLEEKRQDMA